MTPTGAYGIFINGHLIAYVSRGGYHLVQAIVLDVISTNAWKYTVPITGRYIVHQNGVQSVTTIPRKRSQLTLLRDLLRAHAALRPGLKPFSSILAEEDQFRRMFE